MKIFLDTSDVDVIKHHYQTGLVDGVTTNPTLMMQAGRNPVEVISEISSVFSDRGYHIGSISAEVVADSAEEMVLQAEQYHSIGENITIKVPCTYEGLKACKELSERDIKVNVTLIFSLNQSILAAKAGATYISPFIGRCEDNDIDGIDLISSKEAQSAFDIDMESNKVRDLYGRNDFGQRLLLARRLSEVGVSFVTVYNGGWGVSCNGFSDGSSFGDLTSNVTCTKTSLGYYT